MAGTSAIQRIALEAALFRSLMANVAADCRVHDGPGHSDGRVWRHTPAGVKEASEFDYVHLANVLVRTAGLAKGEDPQGRMTMIAETVGEVLAELGPNATRRDVILKELLAGFEPQFSYSSPTCFGWEGVVDFADLADEIEAAIVAREACETPLS